MSVKRPKILLLEDEILVGMALADDLAEREFDVLGPFGTVDDARAAIEQTTPDAAFLDINLGVGRTSFGLAEDLAERGVPFAFLTGYSETAPFSDRFADVVCLSKPVTVDLAVATLEQMLASRSPAAAG